MSVKKQILKVIQILIAIIIVAAIASLIILPHWKGIFIAGAGGFLIINLIITMLFIKNNYNDKDK